MDSFIIVKCVSLSLVIFLALKSTSSVRNIASPAVVLTWSIISLYFNF